MKKGNDMKKILTFITVVASLMCLFAITVSAQVDPNVEYYDKVYTAADGTELALYEKVGDTYYPLVWFKYENEAGEVKYIKVHFEDVTTKTHAYSQGRLNGIYYTYVDESGASYELNASNIALLNLRDGALKSYDSNGNVNGSTPIKTFETRGGEPGYGQMEAIYLPLSFTGTFGYCFSLSSLRVVDIDKNHTTQLTLANHVVDGSKITEFFIPGNANLTDNSHFKGCALLETIVIGKGFAQGFAGYTFSGCTNLKYICVLGDKAQAQAIIDKTANNNNGHFFSMTLISYEEFSKLEDKSGKYIIYDCSPCFAFRGVHTPSDSLNATVESYFGTITVSAPCDVDGCNECITVDTIAPIFTWKGYSACTFGEGYSVVQGYYVNQTAINDYLVYAPDFDYGVLATVNKTGEAITPKAGDDGVLSGDFVKGANDYLDIKVTGIPAGHENTPVVFCVYVTVGDKVYYLDDEKTTESIVGKSYNDILG